MKKVFVLIGIFMLLGMSVPALGRYEVGDVVSDFTLNDLNGNPVSLYDYQGMVLFVTFWTFG